LITPMMLAICLDELSIPSIAPTVWRTTSPERSASAFEVETRSRASCATSAVRRTVAVI
jgi:hypothetical protein